MLQRSDRFPRFAESAVLRLGPPLTELLRQQIEGVWGRLQRFINFFKAIFKLDSPLSLARQTCTDFFRRGFNNGKRCVLTILSKAALLCAKITKLALNFLIAFLYRNDLTLHDS